MNIEKSDEIQAPLGDGEISRLIQAASKASYQPVAGYSRPKDVSFQKHNLIKKPLTVKHGSRSIYATLGWARRQFQKAFIPSP